MSLNDSYIYRPLSSQRSVRVLELLPIKAIDTGLEIKLHDVSIDNPPAYDAVSYTWEGQAATIPIRLGERYIMVTPNVSRILSRLQPAKSLDLGVPGRRLWIDSICIDQSSDFEKNVQIPLMGDVYRKAAQVLVWLGEETPASNCAFRYLVDVSKIVAEYRRAVFEQESHGLYAHVPISLPALAQNEEITSKILNRKADFDEESKDAVRGTKYERGGALEEVFTRPWFQRMWTVQEIALASSVTLLCGTSEILYDHIEVAGPVLSILDPKRFEGAATYAPFWPKIRIYHQMRQKLYPKIEWKFAVDVSFCQLLRDTREFQCWKDADKCYGLYGFLSAAGIGKLPDVDVNKPYQDVYVEFTKAAMLADNSLGLLNELGEATRDVKLPSWVVDYNQRRIITPMDRFEDIFSATKGSSPWFEFPAGTTNLLLRGRIIDTVERAMPSIMPPTSEVKDDVQTGPPAIKYARQIQTVRKWHAWVGFAFAYQLEDLVKDNPRASTEYWVHTLRSVMLHDGHTRQGNRVSETIMEQFGQWWFRILFEYLPEYSIFADISGQPAAFKEFWDKQYTNPSRPAVAPDDTPLSEEDIEFLNENVEVRVYDALMLHARDCAELCFLNGLGKTIFRTTEGFLGTGSQLIRVGDRVALIRGLNLPLIIREESGLWRIIAPAYIHGIMHGERYHEDDELETFTIA